MAIFEHVFIPAGFVKNGYLMTKGSFMKIWRNWNDENWTWTQIPCMDCKGRKRSSIFFPEAGKREGTRNLLL